MLVSNMKKSELPFSIEWKLSYATLIFDKYLCKNFIFDKRLINFIEMLLLLIKRISAQKIIINKLIIKIP